MHSWRTGSRDIVVQPFDGGPAELLTSSPSQQSYPQWLPDGSLVFIDQQVEEQDGSQVYRMRRDSSGMWTKPQRLALPPGRVFPTVTREGGVLYVRPVEPNAGEIGVLRPGEAGTRRLYSPRTPGSPLAARVVASEDGRSVYFKAHDASGRASFWSMPGEGGQPKLLVRFDDLSRPSRRFDFDVANGIFYFTIENRRSNIQIAEVTE
jgi:Tol biopolymer transport system component